MANTSSTDKAQFSPLVRTGIGRNIVGIGAAVMLMSFFLFPWASGPSPMGGNEDVTGFQIVLSELSPVASELKQLGIIQSTPGLWPLLVPIVAILVLVSVFFVDRFPRWRRVSWIVVVVAGLISVYPLYRFLSNGIAWIVNSDSNSAFVYLAQNNSGMGLYATLIGIVVVIVGALCGIVGKTGVPTNEKGEIAT